MAAEEAKALGGGSGTMPRTLADSAIAVLHEAILNGEFEPGERLRIDDLATRLQMSPMPIREALRQLDARGLVEHTPHRGAKVAEFSVQDMRETTRVRLVLEPLAVRDAADRLTEEDAEAVREHLKAWYVAKRGKEVQKARQEHARFHLALYGAAGSRWLMRSILPAWENGERYRLEGVEDRETLQTRMEEHTRILDHCVAGEADAAGDALHDHLAATANTIGRRMGYDGNLFAFRGKDAP